jgi:predicted DNA-binding transcriptional regulator YafY
MNFKNRIERISLLLKLLSKGENVSTPNISEKFEVSKKIIQTDFKEYLLPLFSNGEIYYDYSDKVYKANSNFLNKTLFTSDELAIISILKNKSNDKYSDENLYVKVDALFRKFEDELTNKFYQKSSIENFNEFKEEIIQIKNSIENKCIIKCLYNKKIREVYPLKILNLEGFWYLIVYDPSDDRIKTFHLNTIKNINVLNKSYTFDKEKVKSFDNAITAYYKPENKPISVQLFINGKVSRYFIRKPLNKSQRVLKKYEDNSIDLEIYVSDLMEIIPTIQKYIPNINVISPMILKDEIEKNIMSYITVNKDN